MDIKLLAYTFGPIILQKKEQNTSYMEDILKIHKVTQFLIENRFKLIFKVFIFFYYKNLFIILET